jgi:hypothetical protein
MGRLHVFADPCPVSTIANKEQAYHPSAGRKRAEMAGTGNQGNSPGDGSLGGERARRRPVVRRDSEFLVFAVPRLALPQPAAGFSWKSYNLSRWGKTKLLINRSGLCQSGPADEFGSFNNNMFFTYGRPGAGGRWRRSPSTFCSVDEDTDRIGRREPSSCDVSSASDFAGTSGKILMSAREKSSSISAFELSRMFA